MWNALANYDINIIITVFFSKEGIEALNISNEVYTYISSLHKVEFFYTLTS